MEELKMIKATPKTGDENISNNEVNTEFSINPF